MKVLLFLMAALNAAKLTQKVNNTQASYENKIADLIVKLNYFKYDSKHQSKRNTQVTRPSNRRFGMYRKLSTQRETRPNNAKYALTQRRATIYSLITRRASRQNQVDKNRIVSSMFLV